MRRSTFCAAAGALAAATVGRPAHAAGAAAAELDARTIPVVQARLGGRVVHLVIDTRNAASTISLDLAGRLGPQRGLAAGAQTTLTGVSVAGVVLRDHPALVADVGELAREAGSPVDGALGYEAFSDRAITLDYRAGRLTFPDALPDGETTPITWLHDGDASPRLVTFDGLVLDGFPVVAQLDTLVDTNAIVFAAKIPDLAIDNERRAPFYTYEQTPLAPGRIGSIRLGSTLLVAQPVVYIADARTRAPATSVVVVAGDGLLAKRAVTLDFAGSTLTVV
jgi:hypothetical protein